MPPIALDLCLSAGEVTDPLVRPGGRWVSGVHTETIAGDTVSALRMWSIDGDTVVDLLVDPAPVPGRGLSGGVHAWNPSGDCAYVVTRHDGIVEVALHDDTVASVRRMRFDATRSWSTPSLGVDGRTVYAVADWCQLWYSSIDDGAAHLVVEQVDGFLMDADGPTQRYVTWERPHMPWTESSIPTVAPTPSVSLQQPRSTRDGTTRGWISDADGRCNVVLEPDAHCDEWTRITDHCEHAGPVWGPGQRTWCPSPDGGRIAFTRNEEGFGSLWVLDRSSGIRSMVGRGVHGCLSWEGDTLAAYRCGARTPPHVVAYDMGMFPTVHRRSVVEPADARWRRPDVDVHLVEPSMHRATADDGTVVPYRLFRASQPHGGVIVWIHGGPTDQWQVTFRPRHAYWLSRGWAIAVVDHRGTTGWGRAHAEALEGRWGDADSSDTVAVLHDLHREHGFNPATTVAMGGSAGGLTALNVARMARRPVAAVVVSYPVVDLAEMLTGDDPFESHYMPRLIGADSAGSPLVRERSPHLHARQLVDTPLLVFHGDSDHSVPLVHSQRLRDAVNREGGSCTLVVLEGEGHGFKIRANIEREFAETERFLGFVIGGR